ncbi:MAG: 5'-nucleotidase C-terminal domain-containing protein, partial [Cyanobacteriota bacterium]
TIDITATPQTLTPDNNSIKEKGDRVINIKVNGKPLNYKKDYRVAIPDFMVDGGDGFITFLNAKDIVYTDVFLTDVVKEYISKHSPLNIKPDGRIKVEGGLIYSQNNG